MIAAVWRGGKISLEELPNPVIKKEDEVIIKVLASGICGTDLHVFSGKAQGKDGVIRGHEFSGRVVEIGKDVKGIKVGDLVAVDPNITCGHCYFCKRGEINLCENLIALGVDINGGFAEYCVVPYKQLYVFSEKISPIEGAMMEPVACALHGIERLNVGPGDTVLIVGGGALGLVLLQLAKLSGASKVFLVEKVEWKRKIAKDLGADIVIDPLKENVEEIVKENTYGRGADVGIEAVGKTETVKTVLGSVRRGGKVLIFGVSSPEDLLSISPYDIYFRELTIMGSFVNPFTNSRALSLIEEGMIDVKKIVSHRFSIEKIDEAIKVGLSGDALRVIINF
ncbi:MAG: zinc-dependent alcohol dehydrogenase family protein [Dictyoglomus thermophilum]|uniref:Alcohol dehydrogenase n=1 Tax=Dictyoglomus thermophilum TaxID=14 RepID=A0A7C2CRB4_DICTH|nr:zinc-dependent alcohol dehydrogenase family protein [Dictyoglomus thermophilum]MCX7720262.1 zinc-dependent alcohol dehydrogenase family protein [Dictyoglomus thermophilum]TYT23277.1 zinc-dependent alcohol dehydrogenase family protein [Dictyoglomus thermophilum]